MKTVKRTLTIKAQNTMKRYSLKVWALLKEAYKNVKGGLHFNSIEQLINTTAQWKVIVVNNEVIAVTVYKAKKGLKIAAFACAKIKDAKDSLARLITKELKTAWIEVSERAENFVLKYCDGSKYIIPNNEAKTILNKSISLCSDGLHYVRTIQNIRKEKLLLGTIQA